MSVSKSCYRCGRENPAEQSFCGACGSPLAISEYISATVKDQIEHSIRDRNLLETESAIKVFNKALSWMKLMLGIAAGLLILAGSGVFWKVSDFGAAVNTAKQSVTETAKKSSDDIANVSVEYKRDIATSLKDGKDAIKTASVDAIRQSQDLKKTTIQSKSDISSEVAAFQTDLVGS